VGRNDLLELYLFVGVREFEAKQQRIRGRGLGPYANKYRTGDGRPGLGFLSLEDLRRMEDII
jgi:hypothetical protein